MKQFTQSHPLNPCQLLWFCFSLSSFLFSTVSSWSFGPRLLFPSRDSFPVLFNTHTHKQKRLWLSEKRVKLQMSALNVTSKLSLSFLSTKRPSLFLSVVQFNCTTKGLSSRSSLRSYSTYKTQKSHIKSQKSQKSGTLIYSIWLFLTFWSLFGHDQN